MAEPAAKTEDVRTDEVLALPAGHKQRGVMALAIAASLALVGLMLVGGFNLVYAGKVLPGVRAHGVYLGGLTRTEAVEALEAKARAFEGSAIAVAYNSNLTRINVDSLELSYDAASAADEALAYGRAKSLGAKLKQQLRTVLGRATNVAVYSYSPSKLTPYVQQVIEGVSTPATNASFDFKGGKVGVTPAGAGRRVDTGTLSGQIEDRLAHSSAQEVEATTYILPAAISDSDIAGAAEEAELYLAGPVEITASPRQFTLNTDQIATWLAIDKQVPSAASISGGLTGFYTLAPTISLKLDEAKLEAYVQGIAAQVDQAGQDAALTISGGRATVFRASRDGRALNQPAAVSALAKALSGTPSERLLTFEVKVTKPAVTADNINNLGIKELIGEGVSSFPGSTYARIQNIRVGTARYQGVLVAPGEVFSFGEILGEVSAATGYAPAKVIIGNKQEDQYGGGLCQVSSTTYRAALNAGLPIVQRQNHSFAVSYYTNPYGVPGVDATIYYPQVDFKFRNDTGAHILIQTVLSGTNLKFQFYGTKVKTGRIRGPYFVSGSHDHTKASHTVFYRDVLDLAGKVIKTDTVHTYYQSSLKFPSQPQFN